MSVLVNDSGSLRVACLEPSEVAGLAIDFDPLTESYADNAQVDLLTDSVAGYTLAATFPQYYIFKKDVSNNFPAVESRQNIQLSNTSDIDAIIRGDFTMFVVVKSTAGGTVMQCNNSNVDGGFDLNMGVTYRERNASGVLTVQGTGSQFAVPFGTFQVICINIKRGGEFWLRTNLLNRTRFSTNTPSYIVAAKPVSLGSPSGEGLTTRSYLRLIMYNRNITEREETQIMRGLQLKYKI